jgi:hypothetical protein
LLFECVFMVFLFLCVVCLFVFMGGCFGGVCVCECMYV